MRNLLALMHVSLDGYCAGPKGEMNWITLNDAIFADVHAHDRGHRRGGLWPHHLWHDARLLADPAGQGRTPIRSSATMPIGSSRFPS